MRRPRAGVVVCLVASCVCKTQAAQQQSYYSGDIITCRDCNGNSCDGREDWVGDGECDDGRFGLDFWCDEYSFDDGDCKGVDGHYFDYACVR